MEVRGRSRLEVRRTVRGSLGRENGRWRGPGFRVIRAPCMSFMDFRGTPQSRWKVVHVCGAPETARRTFLLRAPQSLLLRAPEISEVETACSRVTGAPECSIARSPRVL